MFKQQKPSEASSQRRRQTLPQLTKAPSTDDVLQLVTAAQNARGVLIELQVRREQPPVFVLTCQFDAVATDPFWSLYEGEDGSKVLWSYPNSNLEMVYEMVSMSIPSGTGGALPSSLAPQAPAPAPQQPQQAPPGYGAPAYPQGQPYPQQQGQPPYGAPQPPYPQQPYPLQAPGQAYPPVAQPPYPQQPQYPPQNPPYQGYPPQQPGQPGQPYPQQPAQQYPPQVPGPQVPGPQGWGGSSGSFPALQSSSSGSFPALPAGSYPPNQQPKQDASQLRPSDFAGFVDLLTKGQQSNLLLGHLFVEAGVLPEPCLEAALKLQEHVRNGSISNAGAIEALRRCAEHGSALDDDILNKCRAMYPADAPAQAAQPQRNTGQIDARDIQRQVIILLLQSGIVTENDVSTAEGVRRKHGGDVGNILVAAGKIEKATLDAARRCQPLVHEHRLNSDEAFRILQYCQKMKATVDDACRELAIRPM